MINSKAISIQARGNMLKENFFKTFLKPTLLPQFTELNIEGSHHNYYKKEKYLKIYNYTISELEEYAKDLDRNRDVLLSDHIKILTNQNIYYENLSKDEFSSIINLLRQYYLKGGIYIGIDIIQSIVDLYYNENDSQKESD